jgi:hypothetical protein
VECSNAPACAFQLWRLGSRVCFASPLDIPELHGKTLLAKHARATNPDKYHSTFDMIEVGSSEVNTVVMADARRSVLGIVTQLGFVRWTMLQTGHSVMEAATGHTACPLVLCVVCCVLCAVCHARCAACCVMCAVCCVLCAECCEL